MKLGPDGHLRVYEWADLRPVEVADLLTQFMDKCNYPTECGNYGICTNGQCSCPGVAPDGRSYFRPINDTQPSLGCSQITPLSCRDTEYHRFQHLTDVYYFHPADGIDNVDIEKCKQTCLKNCSCKTAFFKYAENLKHRSCFIQSGSYSFVQDGSNDPIYSWLALVEVQIAPNVTAPWTKFLATATPERNKAPLFLQLCEGGCMVSAERVF
ncbi:hypothetical protein FRX31_005091 [Thalictrum thalictroides]|uniref:Apple domain-containing protein n=1 Tax=Thalictrum thalictroides TaxID=46969 RepID=A0A7J6X6D5_THATH|nr:hypothetical protein FRX31_005091 [Thalictrum thalictroides]